MKHIVAALVLCATPLVAQDFSEGSEANEWGLFGEAPARFEAEVTDLLCAVTGDCPEDCGGGARQLGLIRTADDILIYPMKNGEPVFAGAAVELQPYCGQTVEVDGLLINDEEIGAHNVYMVQRILPEGSSEWVVANRWGKVWAENHPEAAGGPWFRNDPRINSRLAETGYLGLGLDVDEAFVAEWY
ncbi:MAG: hypothetical protein AAGG56_07055 [Pseudomonadota bacterium]